MIFLLMVSLYAVCAAGLRGSMSTAKRVCKGGSVILFDKDLVKITGKEVSLYFIKGGILIATWNSTHYLFQKNPEKVFLDGSGNLWIGNTDEEDKGIYEIRHSQDGKILKIYNQEMTILVAPTNCSTNITHTNFTLVASVEGTECGVPNASVYFVQYQHISYIGKTIARLPPGKEGGTYAACLETPALTCVTSFKPSDFCTYFTIPENSNQVKANVTDTMNDLRVLAILSFVLVLIGLPAVAIYIKHFIG